MDTYRWGHVGAALPRAPLLLLAAANGRATRAPPSARSPTSAPSPSPLLRIWTPCRHGRDSRARSQACHHCSRLPSPPLPAPPTPLGRPAPSSSLPDVCSHELLPLETTGHRRLRDALTAARRLCSVACMVPVPTVGRAAVGPVNPAGLHSSPLPGALD
ncbi:hypothetical protein BDA96_03G046600 [Sorghum bicolor]|uniref:Uncharacterized protein n=2 Tax=Sorghum bicolor TaxID=4558 RepID=A0A921ULT0_SORBI|nr:hypothetical protein BDA96_03G046600 [Sorghum bicolor]KXG31698.1 hypothetical protein SORBI_3003G043500 [Sorghum bicolor]